MRGDGVRLCSCPACGALTNDWRSYDCRRCGAFHAALFRDESDDPAIAALSDAACAALWRQAASELLV